MPSLREKIEAYYEVGRRASKKSLKHYADLVVVDSTPKKRWKLIRNAFQDQILNILIPALEAACGLRADYKGPRYFYITLPRGHDKTGTIARLLNGCIAFAKNAIHAIAAASSQKQANILLTACTREANLNPWVSERLNFINYLLHRIGDKTCKLDILSSDAPGATGYLADIIVCDELTQWTDSTLFESLMSGANKRPNCVFIIITNAGILDTWQHKLLQAARQDTKRWFVLDEEGHKASWISHDELRATMPMLLPATAARFFDNKWTSLVESGDYLSRSDILKCVASHSGDTLTPSGTVFSCDLGLTKDRAVGCITHQDAEGVVHLDKMWVWQGTKEKPTPLTEIDLWASIAYSQYKCRRFIVDPYQLMWLVQKYENLCKVRQFHCNQAGNYKLATSLKTAFVNQRIRIPADEELVNELSSLITEEFGTIGHYRFTHREGAHDDRAVALAMGVVELVGAPALRDLNEVLESMAAVLNPATGKIQELKYAEHVKYYRLYDSYFPQPDGIQLGLEYSSLAEACYAVEVYFDGETASTLKNAKEIAAAVRGKLNGP